MIASKEQITREWLSATLKKLDMNGDVAQLDITSAHTYGKSKVFHLNVVYEQPNKSPDKFFLKLLTNSKAYLFNTKMATEMQTPPLIPLYGADYDFPTNQGYPLIANLSGSQPGRLPDSRGRACQVPCPLVAAPSPRRRPGSVGT